MTRPILTILAGLAMASEAISDDLPVSPTIETSLSTSGRQIRQFAFDGDASTFFASAEQPEGSDHFTLILDRADALEVDPVFTAGPTGRTSWRRAPGDVGRRAGFRGGREVRGGIGPGRDQGPVGPARSGSGRSRTWTIRW